MGNPTLLGTGGHSTPVGGQTYTNGNLYSLVGLGRCAMEGVSYAFNSESRASQTIRAAGAISYLSWQLDSSFGSGLTVTLTLKLRQNASDTSLAVSFYPSSSGWITDGTHSVSISSGDALDFVTHVGPATTTYDGSFYCVSARFDATTDSAQMITSVGPINNITPAIDPQFGNFVGILGADPTQDEHYYKFKCLPAGTWQNMAGHIESNTFDKGTTFHNRINGSNGSMGFSASPGQTGTFEDVLHSDSVSVDDMLCYSFVATASMGAGDITIDWLGAHFLATDSTQSVIGGASDGPSQIMVTGSAITKYNSLFGGGNIDTTTPRATGLLPYALTATRLTNHLTMNASAAGTFTLVHNESGSSQALSFSSGQTGWLTDNDNNPVSFDVADRCANQISVSTGTIEWASAGLLVQAN